MKKKMETIDELRKKYNYTYLELAQILNCSKTYIWQLITGKRRLNYEQAIIIASVFNMKPDEIFYANSMDNELIEKINQVSIRKKEIDEQKQ